MVLPLPFAVLFDVSLLIIPGESLPVKASRSNIVAGAVGGIVTGVTVILAVVVLVWRIRKRKKQQDSNRSSSANLNANTMPIRGETVVCFGDIHMSWRTVSRS